MSPLYGLRLVCGWFASVLHPGACQTLSTEVAPCETLLCNLSGYRLEVDGEKLVL